MICSQSFNKNSSMKMARTDPTTRLLAELNKDPRTPEVSRVTSWWAAWMSVSDDPANGGASASTCWSEPSSWAQISSL